MAFDINRKGLSKDQIQEIKDNTIFNIEGNEFGVPITAMCYRATESVVSLPLGLWKLFVNKPPNDTFTKKKYTFSKVLYTKETGKDQDLVAEEAISKLENHSSVFISAFTNYGKCLDPDTQVLMFDGTKKSAKDVKVGDKLMGDDSSVRNVLSITKGIDEMFEIKPLKGESFVVNKPHVLTLKVSGHCSIFFELRINRWKVSWFENSKYRIKQFVSKKDAEEFIKEKKKIPNIIDIPLADYLKLNEGAKHVLKLFHKEVNYPKKEIPLDPYFLGVWLGDGTSANCSVTSVDPEIIEYLDKIAKEFGLTVKKNKKITYNITGRKGLQKGSNKLLCILQELNLIKNKHIPQIYKANSREIRLKVLAGLIDTDGYYKNGCYEITQKNPILSQDILDLCRSLGFGASISKCKKTCTNSSKGRVTGEYYRIIFSGNICDIPVLIKRKKAEIRRRRINPTLTGFKVISKGKGEYCGFELDGNGRFLLGSHMVTHNTTLGVYFFCYFGLKCVVMCHSDVVKDQWIDEFKKTTNAVVGEIEDECDVSVIGVQQAKKLTPEGTKNVGMVIIDEAHMSTATAFTCSLLKFHPRYLIGLSATPDRKDGLHCLFKPYFGNNFIYRFTTKNISVIKYSTGIKPVIVRTFIKNKPSIDWHTVVKSLAENEKRQQKIINIVALHPKNNIIILSDRVAQSTSLFNKLKDKQEDVEILIGTKKKWNKNARVKIIGMKKGGVGMNDENANMLIIASDVTDVRQFEGRLRGDGGIIYDIVDDFKRLEDHWEQRKKWYISRGAIIKYKKG